MTISGIETNNTINTTNAIKPKKSVQPEAVSKSKARTHKIADKYAESEETQKFRGIVKKYDDIDSLSKKEVNEMCKELHKEGLISMKQHMFLADPEKLAEKQEKALERLHREREENDDDINEIDDDTTTPVENTGESVTIAPDTVVPNEVVTETPTAPDIETVAETITDVLNEIIDEATTPTETTEDLTLIPPEETVETPVQEETVAAPASEEATTVETVIEEVTPVETVDTDEKIDVLAENNTQTENNKFGGAEYQTNFDMIAELLEKIRYFQTLN